MPWHTLCIADVLRYLDVIFCPTLLARKYIWGNYVVGGKKEKESQIIKQGNDKSWRETQGSEWRHCWIIPSVVTDHGSSSSSRQVSSCLKIYYCMDIENTWFFFSSFMSPRLVWLVADTDEHFCPFKQQQQQQCRVWSFIQNQNGTNQIRAPWSVYLKEIKGSVCVYEVFTYTVYLWEKPSFFILKKLFIHHSGNFTDPLNTQINTPARSTLKSTHLCVCVCVLVNACVSCLIELKYKSWKGTKGEPFCLL